MEESLTPDTIQIKAQDWDTTFQLISWWDAASVRGAKVLVVGAGALGNEVLKNLALLNVGNILIVDFDRIERSNLSRSILFRPEDAENSSFKAEVAAKQIREINPSVNVEIIIGDILTDVGLGIFRKIDVVIGCLDNRLARYAINQACQRTNKIWIDGAIENLSGQLYVYRPGVSCYASGLSDSDWNQIEARQSCFTVAERNASQGKIPTTPLSASIIAAMQVQEALKVIHENSDQLMDDQRFYYDGMNNLAMMLKSRPIKPELQEPIYDPIHEANDLSVNSTIGELQEWIESYFNRKDWSVRLENDLVLELSNNRTNKSVETFMIRSKLSDRLLSQVKEKPTDDIRITDFISKIDASFPLKDKSLKDLGFPPYHIFRLQFDEEEHYIELSGDKGTYQFI